MKKAIGVATSATFVASLLATVVAPGVAASTLVTSRRRRAGWRHVGHRGLVPVLREHGNELAGGVSGTIIVDIAPARPTNVSFTNATGGAPAPTFTQNPGGLGASTAASGNKLTITFGHGDGVNVALLHR